MTYETKIAALKQSVFDYLNTCEDKKSPADDFWNAVARYRKQSLACKHFGVSKMKVLLERFQDVLTIGPDYISLKPDITMSSGSEQIVISDSSESEEEDKQAKQKRQNTSKQNRTKSSSGRQGSLLNKHAQFREKMLFVLNSLKGKANLGTFLNRYEAMYGKEDDVRNLYQFHSDIITVEGEQISINAQAVKGSTNVPANKTTMPTWGHGAPRTYSRERNQGAKQGHIIFSDDESDSDHEPITSQKIFNSNLSGFIPLSGGPSNQGQVAHQRYALPSGGPGMTMPGHLRPPARTPVPTSGAASFQANFSMLGNMGQTQQSAYASPALLGPSLVMVPQQSQNLLLPLQHQMVFDNRSSGQLGELMANRAAVSQTKSEWPVPPVKTGPPPGTKITDEVKEVIVKPLSLPRNSRLTGEQVDAQIKECIEVLSDAKEHVSLERVEALLLQKFMVRNFRDLHLQEKNFTFMPSAKDHSLLLGKVNMYIQNFVRSRSLCTLYELQECCREFHPKRESFHHLRLGPLQKMPAIYDLFKFPMDEYIPEITSTDVLEQLNNFLDRTNKWTQQTSVDEFMQYLVEVYHVQSAFSLGLRLRSLPLAIQMLKKSKRDAGTTRKKVVDDLKEILQQDLQAAFKNFRASIMQSSSKGHELRFHYMNLTPEVAIREIFTKFELLSHIFNASPTFFKKIEKILKHFNQFVKTILEVPLPRQLFHLSVCMSNVELQDCATELLETEAKQQQLKQETMQQQETVKKVPPTKVSLTEKVLQYINKCLEQGPLKLSHLQRIETRVAEDFEFPSFRDMGYGTFLEFIHSEAKIKKVIEECGGALLGSSFDHDSMYKPSLLELLEFLCQAKLAGITQAQAAESSICEQYHVGDIRHLGHGNISRLFSTADKPGKHVSPEYNTYCEAALCGKSGPSTHIQGQVGLLGSITKEAALACLTACPLLEDMEKWSNWSAVFQPQHGRLKDFVKKYGGLTRIPLEGGKKICLSDFKALEVEPGKFLKVNTCTSVEHFASALQRDDPLDAAGQLVSLIVANKGLESTPLALVSNHLKDKLISLHAFNSATYTPGGPPTADTVDLAVRFVTEMLLRLPVRICAAVANQVLLEPLSKVVGSAKSKEQIVRACKLPHQLQHLGQLGLLLGLHEWYASIQTKFVFPSHCIEETLEDEFLGTSNNMEDDEQEEEESEESDSEESESDSEIDDMLDSGESVTEVEASDRVGNVDTEPSQETAGGTSEDRGVSPQTGDITVGTGNEQGQTTVDAELIKAESGDRIAVNEKDQKIDSEMETERSDSEDTPDAEMKDVNEDKILTLNDEEQTKEVVEERELTQEEKCRLVVDDIRKEEFGVGIQLDETGQKLMLKQQERQGRSLQRLSKDLYSKDTHFVLELIQNADDNGYSQEVFPALKFIIDHTGVKVLNNELGFKEENVRAICDVGKSTKSKHTFGYIGQKGIGFKSVFRMTGCPEVHSNGFHIYFDVNSGPMGYILPHWKENFELVENWQTQIVLPWTDAIKQQIHTHAARFNDIQPSLLLFLHRLKEITIENKVEGSTIFMARQDFDNGEIQITHSHGTDKWLVLRKILDASNISLQAKSGVEVESTEIALAFPLKNKKQLMNSQMKPEKLPVFAYLPLRSYGFRFIVQGDFDVPSSREDVDRDSPWNQWLRNEIHLVFIEALEAFKEREELTPVEALIQYLQFIPLEGEVMAFFKPVASQILDQLKAKDCMPVLNADKKSVQWKMPSKTVISHDSLVLDIVSPQVLHQYLDLNYLHPDVAAFLKVNEPLTKALGIESVTTEHLLHIGRSLVQHWESTDTVGEIAKWLACVYRSMDDFQENTEIIRELQKMRIIPLSSGSVVSLSDMTVFMLTDTQATQAPKSKQTSNSKDPLLSLKKDLNLVHGHLINTSDNEVNSQVVKLLLKMGIKQLTPHDLIHSHILPVFKSDSWKEKKEDILVSYLVYIKTELDRNPSVVDKSELSVVKLVTNCGVKSPTEDIHFPTQYGNEINLPEVFPGLDWILVDPGYLPAPASTNDKLTWHKFLSDLGVSDFLKVTKVDVSFDKNNIHETAWSSMKDLWPDSADGYRVTDFQCEEFHRLVTANQNPEKLNQQMEKLFKCLDVHWNTKYKHCIDTQLKSGSGHVLKDNILSSFAVHLHSLSWVPAVFSLVDYDEGSKTVELRVSDSLLQALELYLPERSIRRLLNHTVKYLNVEPQKNSTFIVFLKIKQKLSQETIQESLISWGKRHDDAPDKPAVFCTAIWHMLEIYSYLGDELRPKDCQDLFHNYPIIFVPVPNQNTKGGDTLAGYMMRREEVWWSDPTDLFKKYMKSLETYKSPLSKFKTLNDVYHSIEELFVRAARVEKGPSTLQYAQLLKHIATVCGLDEEGVLVDTLSLISKIGQDLSQISAKSGGVQTEEAMKAVANTPRVTELLSRAAVFPTKLGQWVSLSDSPMIADSKEFEEMFSNKPGVYLLLLDARENMTMLKSHSFKAGIDRSSIDFFISLFPEIKALSECIETEEITEGFTQCNKSQTYLHNVVAPLQRFLYFLFPDVYKLLKSRKASVLKELMFIQVKHLEVKYKLIDHPDVFEIRGEKCVVKDKCFYFHEKYVDSHAEFNRELARFFSEGNENCFKELRNFFTQALPILENKGDETMEELLERQIPGRNCTLPSDEEVWEVPLPKIPLPPEPEPTFMVYEHQSQSCDNFMPGDGGEEKESQGLKSWPPRSAVDKEEAMRMRRDPNKPASIWPPPQAAGQTNVSKLPSKIKFENPSPEIEPSGGEGQSSREEGGSKESRSGPGTSRQYSVSGEDRGAAGHSVSRQTSSDQDHKKPKSEHAQPQGDQPRHNYPGDGTSTHGQHRGERSSQGQHQSDRPASAGSGSKSKSDSTSGGAHHPSQSGDASGDTDTADDKDNAIAGKRKLPEGSREEDFIALKRLNSQEEPTIHQPMITMHQPMTQDEATSAARSEGVNSHSSSSREATPSSSGSSLEGRKSARDKGMLHFTIPNWNVNNEELVYSELAHAEALTIPQLNLETGAQEKEIGLWGEQLVFDYLLRQKDLNSDIESVIWANANGEKGLPFDFEIVLKPKEQDKTSSIFVEVKATVSWDKEVFHVSSKQMEFALVQKDQFEIYRVFGAGNSKAKLVRIQNVSERMRVKQIQLFMVI